MTRPRGRPKKYRIVRRDPKITQFSPRGKPGRPDEATLTMDEFEAIRLSDWSNLSQKQAAKSMKISQQTFSRILKKARRIAADGLVNGKAIKIQGGFYALNTKQNEQEAIAQINPNIPPKAPIKSLKDFLKT